jgi:hypothetical protein
MAFKYAQHDTYIILPWQFHDYNIIIVFLRTQNYLVQFYKLLYVRNIICIYFFRINSFYIQIGANIGPQSRNLPKMRTTHGLSTLSPIKSDIGMNAFNDSAYYLRREQQSRDLAQSARDPGIRKIHLDMAQHYAELATETRAAPREILTIATGPRS